MCKVLSRRPSHSALALFLAVMILIMRLAGSKHMAICERGEHPLWGTYLEGREIKGAQLWENWAPL